VRPVDFIREMRSASAEMEPRDVGLLVGLGIPEILISHFEMVGLCRIRHRGTLYEPDSGGHWYFITPVCVQFAETPESSYPAAFPLVGNVVDLVAWHERAPEQWLLRAGSADWLGCIEPQYCKPSPVRIWRSPLSWLRNRCTGLVPLSRDRRDVYRLIASCSNGLHAEDAEHVAALQNILARPWGAPPIHVGLSREGRRHAA
jgi:hypothetical protein